MLSVINPSATSLWYLLAGHAQGHSGAAERAHRRSSHNQGDLCTAQQASARRRAQAVPLDRGPQRGDCEEGEDRDQAHHRGDDGEGHAAGQSIAHVVLCAGGFPIHQDAAQLLPAQLGQLRHHPHALCS